MNQLDAKIRDYGQQAEALQDSLQKYRRSGLNRVARSLREAGYSLASVYKEIAARLSGKSEGALRTSAPPPGEQALSWFYVGDLIDWLRDHDRVTGVGRTTCELWLASLGHKKGAPFMPCAEAPTACGLASVPPLEALRYVSSKVGSAPIFDVSDSVPTPPVPIKEIAPSRGDHVVFTGVVWTRHYKELFLRLNATAISFSVLVHDIIPIEEPELGTKESREEFIDWLKTVLTLARFVYVSSSYIRDQIIRWTIISGYNICAEIVIIEFGLNEFAFGRVAELNPQDIPGTGLGSFVLSVGTIDRRKNQILLCRLWSRLAQDLGLEKLPQLVLVGRDDIGLTESREDFSALISAGKIRVLQGLSDRELYALYRDCLFTAFPSTSEGYGLPVAESLCMGKLCVASDLAAVRGHAGELPWYFDPADEDSAFIQLKAAIISPDRRHAAERGIAAAYQPRSWAAAFDTLAQAVGRRGHDLVSPRKLSEARPEPTYLRPIPPTTLMSAQRWCRSKNPAVSILIVNWNASELTLECVRQIWANSDGIAYEIIIVDNGSSPEQLRLLRDLAKIDGVRLLELGCNRYFGEANNIAAEHARGDYICLLNNDAFPKDHWLDAMIGVLETDSSVGGVGPLFLFPDGRVQEAGAVVDAGGYPIRFERDTASPGPDAMIAKSVDYISAAAFLLRRDVFMDIGGFDLTYEPAYYEDTDLCLKLHALGKKVLYCPDAVVVHIEGASTKDAAALEARNMLGDLNRGKFVARWGTYLRSRDPVDAAKAFPIRERASQAAPPAATAAPDKTAIVFTPFALTPGGGERYILTLAWALTAHFAVRIVTPNPYSRLRLASLGRDFDIDLSRCEIMAIDALQSLPPADLMIAMGNHVVPPIAAMAPHAIYMCQFPFPITDAEIAQFKPFLDGYDRYLVNSDYSRAYVFIRSQQYWLPPRPIEVVSPPVPQVPGDPNVKKEIILSVGRFFEGGHNKRHDVMIEAFKRLAAKPGNKLALHLAGSSVPLPNQMAYLGKLQKMAEGLDVIFHVNVAPEKLAALYRDAAVYWHAAGMDIDLQARPDAAEHFGISVVEAMSAGCVPLAFNAGGPREIIQHGQNGFLYNSIDELVNRTLELFKDENRAWRTALGAAANQRAETYSVANFADRVRKLALAAVTQPN